MIIKRLRIEPGDSSTPKALTLLVEYEGQDVIVMVSPPPPPGKVGIFLRLLTIEATRHKTVKGKP